MGYAAVRGGCFAILDSVRCGARYRLIHRLPTLYAQLFCIVVTWLFTGFGAVLLKCINEMAFIST